MTLALAIIALLAGPPDARGGHATPARDHGGHATTIIETPVQVGERIAARRGWVGAAWRCMYELGNRESGWTVTKWNRAGSGAYGIGQALPASKMRRYGADYLTSAETQVRWMIGYIGGRYGDPCSALAFHNRNGYY